MRGWGQVPRRSSLAIVARRVVAFTLTLVAFAPGCSAVQPEVGERLTACVDADSNPAVKVSFRDQIRPIMDGRVPGPNTCPSCHNRSVAKPEALAEHGFEQDDLRSLRRGGRVTGETVIVPGKPCSSALVQKLRGTREGARMPKDGPYWTPEQVQLVIDWIAEGAVGADDE